MRLLLPDPETPVTQVKVREEFHPDVLEIVVAGPSMTRAEPLEGLLDLGRGMVCLPERYLPSRKIRSSRVSEEVP